MSNIAAFAAFGTALAHRSRPQTVFRLPRAARLATSATPPRTLARCGHGSYARVIEKLRPGAAEPGDIVHVDGTVLGRHDGIIHFTVGQRRGLGVGSGEPLYVVRVEAPTRRVVVGPRESLVRTGVTLRGVNWLGAAPPVHGTRVEVKLRSTSTPLPATLALRGGGAVVTLERPEYGVAAGQACVFYRDDRALGGGWIAPDEARAA